jgi:hypothetical protein
MKKYFSEKYKMVKSNFQNLRSKTVIRMSNLAKRFDPSHRKDEKKK